MSNQSIGSLVAANRHHVFHPSRVSVTVNSGQQHRMLSVCQGLSRGDTASRIHSDIMNAAFSEEQPGVNLLCILDWVGHVEDL